MTNTDITVRLNSLKTKIEEGKVEKTRAETNLESYTKQRDEIVAEMAQYSVNPETIDEEIERLEEEIEDNLARAEELLQV